MNALSARIRGDSGQAFVFVAVLTGLVGMAALVIDGGSWYQADRKLQTAADAAALAGAQELPTQQSQARTVAPSTRSATTRASRPRRSPSHDGTIHVAATAKTPGIFAPILDSAFNDVTVSARAEARVTAPSKLKDVAPIAVNKNFACIVTDPSCFGQPRH